ncbi:hypothetical protein CSC70_01700 [Pseudoxanthomonas kalamensis DSM 18571]|nr:hypothetical protein CSC70_01700 [Pseudoxanthomonas kalamensis DSM 18571]
MNAGEVTFATLDAEHTRLGFELSTRWGQTLEGRFHRFEGRVLRLADGRHQVLLRMETGSIEIIGHPRYTKIARSERFFDADRHPAVTFRSQPYDPALLTDGGELAGELSIRGVAHTRTLTMQPPACARPGFDCEAVATGTVSRSDYGMDDWKLAVGDPVVFVLNARLRENTGQ